MNTQGKEGGGKGGGEEGGGGREMGREKQSLQEWVHSILEHMFLLHIQ